MADTVCVCVVCPSVCVSVCLPVCPCLCARCRRWSLRLRAALAGRVGGEATLEDSAHAVVSEVPAGEVEAAVRALRRWMRSMGQRVAFCVCV